VSGLVVFRVPRVNVIESDEGFSVEVLGRTGLKYVQGDKTLLIDSEVLAVPNNLVVAVSGITNWESGERISGRFKKKITNNIVRAFNWRGAKIILR
jgi:hypothetical protein